MIKRSFKKYYFLSHDERGVEIKVGPFASRLDAEEAADADLEQRLRSSSLLWDWSGTGPIPYFERRRKARAAARAAAASRD